MLVTSGTATVSLVKNLYYFCLSLSIYDHEPKGTQL